MGGVPRHRACKQCTRRRVKCDELRPSCRTCTRLGLSCPGYNDGQLTWRDETLRLRQKQGVPCSTLEIAMKSSDSKPKHHRLLPQTSCLAISPSFPHHLFQIVYLHPFANSHINPSAASLVRTLNISAYAGSKPENFESYISFIPSRLGRSSALDDAVDCLTTLYSAMLLPNCVTVEHSSWKYERALSTLRKYLGDSIRVLEPETLCATLLLGIYEILANSDEASPLKHVHGASALIRHRGPERHIEPFERAMLLAAQGPLSTESITTGSSSSLDSEIWRELITDVPPDSILEEDRPCQKLKFFNGLSIPQLIQNLFLVLRSEHPEEGKIVEVLSQAMQFRSRFLRWAKDTALCRLTAFGPGNVNKAQPEKQDASVAAQLLAKALSLSIESCPILDIGAYGNYYGMMIIINRVILCLGQYHQLTLSPAFFGAYTELVALYAGLENENKYLANMAFETETFLRASRPLALLYYKFSLHVARATLSTTDNWADHLTFRRRNEKQAPLGNEPRELFLMENFLGSIRQSCGI